MKKIYNLLFVIGLSTLFYSCDLISPASEARVKTNDIYIMVDNTEESESREDLILTENVVKMVENGGKVTWQNINSVSLNSRQTIDVSFPENPTRFQKMEVLEPFTAKFEKMRERFLGPVKKETENSSIYKPICEALKKLEDSKADYKTLVIVSDMIENSQYANFYRNDQKFDAIKDSLNRSGVSLPEETNHLRVVILYTPKDLRHEIQHDKAMRYWEQLFKEVDIPFEVQPNL